MLGLIGGDNNKPTADNTGKKSSKTIYIILSIILVLLVFGLVFGLGWHLPSEDGKFSDWSEWSACDKECEGGNQIKTRTYTPKVNNGKDLPDKDNLTESQSCNTQLCVINGKYNNWSNWGSCVKSQTDNTSITCGPGKQKRIRTYSQPMNDGNHHPDYTVGDTDLQNKLVEWQDCTHSTIPNCPINGSYNNWSEYGTCVKSQTDSTPITCGTGKKSRTRTYNAPLHRGSHHTDYTVGKTDLDNKLIEWENCTHPTVPNCPINGSYSEWITQAGCVQSSTVETPITCVSSTIPGVQKKTRTYNAPLHGGSHHTDYTVGNTDLQNKLIEWETCSNISRVCQSQDASCSSWTNDGNPFCNTTSNQYQIKQKRTYTPARDGGVDLASNDDNNLCKTRLSHERTILARSDANIALSEGVCPANGIMTAFSTPIDSNCTPATGKNRVQYLVATYTFPTSSTNTHDSNFTALGFSPSQINDIKNLTTSSELTINANNFEYNIKRTNTTNTTFPYIYEIKKKVSCSDVYTFSPSQINAAWKQATGCTQDLNTTIYSQINNTEDNLRYLNSIENVVRPTFDRFTANSLIQTKNTNNIKLCYGDHNNTGYVTVNNNNNDKAQYTAGSIFPPGIKIKATNVDIVQNGTYKYRITNNGGCGLVKESGTTTESLMNHSYTESDFGSIVMEHGGNLVIFSNVNPSNILWQSGTGSHSGAYLELDTNGSLYIKNSSGTIVKYLYIPSSIQDSTWTSTTGCTQSLDNNILTTLTSNRTALSVLDSLTSLANVFNPFTAISLISNPNTDKIKLCYGDNNNTGYVTVNTTNKSNYTARAIFPPGIRITATDIAIVENTTYKYMIDSGGRFSLFNKSNSQTYLISPTYTGSNFGSLVMEHGGNLVIFSNTSSSSILWSSGTGTSGNSGAYLELESNGSLIIKKRNSSNNVTIIKILYSNGLMTVNNNPSNFPAKSEALCTPAFSTSTTPRTQNVTVNYTFPTIDNGLHDPNFTAIGFSTTQIAAITNLPLNGSTSYDITVSSTTNRYTIKKTNNSEPKTYEITKTLICEYVDPLPKNWKNYDYSIAENGILRCGPDFKNTACPDNKCCSSLGYCGGTTGDNGAHCYTVLGWNGFYNDKTPVLPKNWKNINHSTTFIANGSRRCGPDFGSCPDEQCCSSAGYCGGTTGENDDYCGTSISGGNYNSKEPKNWKGNIYSTTVESGGRRCGPDFNNTACLGNQCCSSAGYCGGATGANDVYCSTSKSNGDFNHKEPTGRCTSNGIWGTQTVYNGNNISMSCPDGTTRTATCNNGGWKDIGKCPKYIFRTYASNGTLNTYVMPNDGIHWEEAVAGRNKDNAVETLNYNGGTNRDGNRGDGIEFKNNSSTVFATSSNDNSQNSYSKGNHSNSSTAVYNLTAPNGYTKESKYLYRYQSGPDYVYAVFKNDNW